MNSGVPGGPQTLQRLRLLVDLLKKWNPAINLVAPSTLDDSWSRHILDSSRLATMVPSPDHWVDLGSGAGFPGMVIAIVFAEVSPGSRVTLVESDMRKASFLRTVAAAVAVPVEIIDQRIESVPPLAASVVSARALAPLDRLLPMVHRHIAVEGVALLPKGSRAGEELASVTGKWSFDVKRHASDLPGSGEVLEIRNLRHG